jgi:methionyl-tRNA formyltransferase
MDKLYIGTSRSIGEKCIEWVKNTYPYPNGGHTPLKYDLVDDIWDCDIFISILYDKIVPPEFIKGRRCYNFHPGILPRYRGSGICSWVLINKDYEHGVTLHEISSGIDCGNIIDVQKFLIRPNDTAEILFRKSEDIIYNMFAQWLPKLYSNTYSLLMDGNQNFPLYSCKKLDDAKDLTHIVRAFTFPGKESAYYYTKDGRKVYLDYVNGPNYK